MRVRVKVTPNARKNEVRGFKEGTLYVKICAPPVDGKANKELLKFFEKIFKVKNIKIISGEKARVKIVNIPLSEDEIFKILQI